MRKRTNPIWKVDIKNFVKIIDESNTISEVVDKIGIKGRYRQTCCKTVVRRAEVEKISLDGLRKRFKKYNKNFLANINKEKTIPLKKILINNSHYNRGHLKDRLIKNKILKNECAICKQKPKWNNQILVMVLDHINGVKNDNRLNNLRLLCPNCNSQQSTFAGRNIKKQRKLKKSEINPEWRNACRPKTRKVKRPDKEELLKLLWEIPTAQLAKRYGVTDKAIEKWSKAYGITKPARGYWAKKSKSDKKYNKLTIGSNPSCPVTK